MSLVTDNSRYLNFALGQEEFAIPLLTVKEVIAVPEMTPIPHTPAHFLGIMNLRGQVISVIDLRKKFTIPAKNSEETCVVIIDLDSHCMGVVVDSVNSVLAVKANEVMDKPSIESSKNTDYITGVYRKDEKLVLFIDIVKTLSGEEKHLLQKQSAKAA